MLPAPILAFLARPAVKYGALGLAIAGLVIGTLLVVNHIYRKGETAGGSTITNAVQTETIKTLDAARISKEKTDEEVRRTPYDDRVDGLR